MSVAQPRSAATDVQGLSFVDFTERHGDEEEHGAGGLRGTPSHRRKRLSNIRFASVSVEADLRTLALEPASFLRDYPWRAANNAEQVNDDGTGTNQELVARVDPCR